MLDHVSLGVSDLEASAAFYDAVLAALGHRRLYEFPGAIAYGSQSPSLWINLPLEGQANGGANGSHVALQAPSRDAVEAFYAAGLASGGRDAGVPGPRPEYTPDYYAAFLYDPDGHKIEAVCYAKG